MLFYLFLPELFFLFFILSSLLFSILHSKRYGIFLTSYNLKLSFSLISFFLIYLKFSLLSLTLTSFFFLLSLLLTNLIIWFIDLPRNLDETFYYFFTLFSSMFLISSINLISFYLLLELFSFSLYLLVTIGHDTPRIDTSLHYFILGSLFSCFFLLGLYFLYYTTGETNLINISLLSPYIDSRLYTLGCLLIYLSLFFKLGVSPFSLWVPTVYYGASSNVSIFLSTLPKLPLLFILYIFSNYLHTPILSFILSLSIILSLLIGSISALNVTNLKSLLAYSSINSLGFLLIPLYISNRLSLLLILYYLLIYFLSTLFIWIFMLNTNIYNIGSLRPIFFTNKFLAYSFIIALFSLAGIPPLLGFFPKFSLFIFSINHSYYLITILALSTTLISTFYYIRLISLLLFTPINLRSILIHILNYNTISYYNTYIIGYIIYLLFFGIIIIMGI